MRMIPRLVDIAVAWEGCDAGDKDRQLTELGVNVWTFTPGIDVHLSNSLAPPGMTAVPQTRRNSISEPPSARA